MRIDNVNRIITVLIATSRLEGLHAAPVPAQDGGGGKEHAQLGSESDAQLTKSFQSRSDSTGGLNNPLPYMPKYNKRTLVKAKRDVKDQKEKKRQQSNANQNDDSDEYSTNSEYDTSDEEEGTHAGTSKWGPSTNQYWKGKWGGAVQESNEQKKAMDADCQTEERAKNLPVGVCKQESVADNIVGV